MKSWVARLAFCALAAVSADAQLVISAHSGVVQYVEGRAYLDGNPVDPKFGQFPDIKNNQEFRTEEGRAEILLTPGVFLRLGENSSIRMLSSSLTDTRVEVLHGSAIVECDQMPKDNSITLVYQGNSIALLKHGLYRVDTESARLQVYDGEAEVKNGSAELTLKSGKQTALDGTLSAENFDKNATDELYRWANRRAGYVAQANVSSASSLSGNGYGYDYGYGYSGYGYGYGGYGFGYPGYGYLGAGVPGGWNWNPVFGLFTWVPFSGIGYSPFGYPFWSPGTVFNAAPVYSGYRSHSPAAYRSGLNARPSTGAVMGAHSGGFGAHGGGLGAVHGGGGFGGGHASSSGGHGR